MVERRRVLLTGATGFIGSRVHPALEAEGFEVIGGSRDPRKAESAHPGRRFVKLDLTDPSSVVAALGSMTHAVYLVHSMATSKNYENEERAEAKVFAEAAAERGLEKLVYLGGMRPNGEPSRHLRSRLATGETLRGGRVPTVELQATMVVGAGSESFRMVRDLSARLPMMLLPKWSNSKTEPIGVDDVAFAICRALADRIVPAGVHPLPGPEILTAREILLRTARLLGGEPRLYYLPLISPKLSSYWIRLVTRSDHRIADELVEGLRTDILSPDPGFWKLYPEHRRQSFEEAARLSLKGEAAKLSTTAQLVESAVERLRPESR